MDDINVSENNVELAEPQEQEIESTEVTSVEGENDTVPNDNVESGEVVEPQEKVQTPEVNAAYAQARREFEAKAQANEQASRDKLIAEMNMSWNNAPITTEAEYRQAMIEKEAYDKAIEQGQSPEMANKMATLERMAMENQEKLQQYERQNVISQQESQLLKDEIVSPIYSENKDEILAIANNYGVDLEAAFSVYIRQNLGKILSSQSKNVEQKTINNIISNGNATPGALGDNSQTPIPKSVMEMTSEEFREYREKRLNSNS